VHNRPQSLHATTFSGYFSQCGDGASDPEAKTGARRLFNLYALLFPSGRILFGLKTQGTNHPGTMANYGLIILKEKGGGK
jgi:hypothetical protein